MPTKVRKQIYIEPRQEQTLKRLARLRGDSEAEIIRQAIDAFTTISRIPPRDMTVWEAEKAYIRSLMAQGPVEGGRRDRRHQRSGVG